MAPVQSKFSINILNFDGDPDLLDFFFDSLQELKEINKWSEKQTIIFFKTKITGVALKYFIESDTCSKLNTIEDIRKNFKAFFKKESREISLMNLNNLKLLPSESILNLAHRVENLVKKAYPNIVDVDALNDIKLQHFLNVLPLASKTKILEAQIVNFDEAVKRAQIIQDVEISTNVLSCNNIVQPGLNEEINLLKQEITDLKSQSQNVNKDKSHYNSKFSKHKHHNKFFKPRGQFHNNKFRNYNKDFRNSVNYKQKQCAFCGKFNHIMKNCFEFKRLFPDPQSNHNATGYDVSNYTYETNNNLNEIWRH